MKKVAGKISEMFGKEEVYIFRALEKIRDEKWHQLNNETSVLRVENDWVCTFDQPEINYEEFTRVARMDELGSILRELVRQSFIGKTPLQCAIDRAWEAKNGRIQDQVLSLYSEIFAGMLNVPVNTKEIRLEHLGMVIHNVEIMFRAAYLPETDTLAISECETRERFMEYRDYHYYEPWRYFPPEGTLSQ